MKTLILYTVSDPLETKSLLLDGDYSKFDGLAINYGEHPLEEEFSKLMWDDEGNELLKLNSPEETKQILVSKDFDKVAFVFFLY